MAFDFPGFQLDAFQTCAFQQEVDCEFYSFQRCAFQDDAFQTEPCYIPVPPQVVSFGGGGGGGHKGWSRREWQRKKQFEDGIEATLKAALTPADRQELATELLPAGASPEVIAKVARMLTPRWKPRVITATKAANEPWEDEDDEAVFLLLGGW